MQRSLFLTTAIVTTSVLAWSAPALAENIPAKRTDNVRTSTIKAGAADNIVITSAGSVEPTSGVAVTIDSNNSVTNEGKIVVTNASNAAGIVANAGTTGDIINATTGTITIDETFAPTDIDNDGDLDGPFATGSGRSGIRTLGAHTGKVTNSGTITIEGNDSAGLLLGGPLTGNLLQDGTIKVTGDRAVGLRAEAITGNVRLAGSVSATGVDAVAARFTGDVTGAMVVQGAITSTGYRFVAAPADPSKLDADDLLQGGPALLIEGNVTGGIVLAVPPKDASTTDNDEDKDGIADDKEGSASVTSYGAAPAMVIGATDRAITVGAVAGNGTGFGLQIDGAVNGNGVYAGVSATGLQIGGRGGAVTIAGGMSVAGTVAATSKDSNATALRIGAGASVPEVRVSGSVFGAGSSLAGTLATGIQVDAGASVATIRNSGTIKATTTGGAGAATAVRDLSGGVTLVENSGKIVASGATGTAGADSGRNIAIDLSANTSGVTVKQVAVASGVAAPEITGDVRTGSGNDVFDLADGTFTGSAYLGAGNDRLQLSGDAVQTGKAFFGAGDDAMTLAGTASFTGTADFAGGGLDTLTLGGTSRFSGTLANAGALAVSVNGGTLDLSAPSAIGSLAVASGGTLLVTLDKDAGQGTSIAVGGTASFATGSVLQLKLSDVATAEGRYTILTAGTLQGASNLTTKTDLIPFMYKASLASDAPANQLAVNIARKSNTELGFNASQASAYNAFYTALGTDAAVAGVFLGLTNGEAFRAAIDQVLPDHAGGTFRGISLGNRTLARAIADPTGPIAMAGNLKISLSAAGWGTTKPRRDTAAYDINGLGAAATAELETGIGSFGASLSWLWNENNTGGSDDNSVISNTYQLAGFWHGKWGGLSGFARGSIGRSNFDGKRAFVGMNGATRVERITVGKWNGTLTTFAAGAAYEGGGQYFFFRPAVTVDYTRLKEDGHTETGGGTALNLTVADRTSKEVAVEGGLTLGLDFTGNDRRDSNWFRVEAEGGWREVVDGSIGATTARFGTGTPFTLEPEQIDSGWYARLRAIGGTSGFQMGGEFGAEDQNGRLGLSLRGTLRMPF